MINDVQANSMNGSFSEFNVILKFLFLRYRTKFRQTIFIGIPLGLFTRKWSEVTKCIGVQISLLIKTKLPETTRPLHVHLETYLH